jgi:hypothetical protein
MKRNLNLTIEESLIEKGRKQADAEGRSLSGYVEQLFKEVESGRIQRNY